MQISNCKFVLRIGQSYFALMAQFKIFEGKRQEEGGGGKPVSQNYKHLKKKIFNTKIGSVFHRVNIFT